MIDDQTLLAEIAKSGDHWGARLLAVKKNAKTEKEKSLKNVIVQISKYQEMKRNYSKENFIKTNKLYAVQI